MFFGDVGVCWAIFGAPCCSKWLYMVQSSLYAVFAVSDRHARKVRTGLVEGKMVQLGGQDTKEN